MKPAPARPSAAPRWHRRGWDRLMRDGRAPWGAYGDRMLFDEARLAASSTRRELLDVAADPDRFTPDRIAAAARLAELDGTARELATVEPTAPLHADSARSLRRRRDHRDADPPPEQNHAQRVAAPRAPSALPCRARA